MVVEVGIKLDKDINKYIKLMEDHGLNLSFNCITHDKYYTKKNLDGMSDKEMHHACIRLRNVRKINEKEKNKTFLKELILKICGYKKVFDTCKIDYQYGNEKMKSRVQLQLIDDKWLVCYYDNPEYYDIEEKEQRNKLIDDLNSYGFSISYDTIGFDKLRSLYYKEEKYSWNQSDK